MGDAALRLESLQTLNLYRREPTLGLAPLGYAAIEATVCRAKTRSNHCDRPQPREH